MKYVVGFVLLMFFWFTAHETILNDNYNVQSYQRLTYALENAADDAALQVTPESISDGNIIFDQSEADAAFRRTLGDDLRLDPVTLQPQSNSVYKVAPTVLTETFLDYSNTTFPYHYVNTQYGIDTWIYGPSIVYAVTIQAPKFSVDAPTYNFSWSTVASYPDAS